MARFVYEKLTEHQLRIGIGLLNQEQAVVDVLDEAANTAVVAAVEGALAKFDIKEFGGDNLRSLNSGAAGGARARDTKSRSRSRSSKRAGSSRKSSSAPSLTADQQASRELQGRYLAAIRSVPKTRRAKYKALVKTEGRQTAIDAIYHDYPRKG